MHQINSIKTGFEKWLEQHVGAQAGTFKSGEDVSIFAYASEFMEYVSDSLNGQNPSMTLSELLELDIEDGKFVLPDETTGEETPLSATEETPEQTQEVASLLNNLFSDENFKKAVDANQDGVLSEEEITNFINALSGVDGNADDVSIQDIVGAMQGISEGKKIEEIATKAPETTETSETPQVESPSPSSGGDYNPGSYDSSDDQKPKEKTLDTMSASELNTELTAAKSTLSDKQSELSSAIDGSTPKLKELKNNIETTYKAYHEELEKVDKEKADELNTLKEAIDAKQSETDETDKQIAQQESTVSSCESAYNNAVSTRETLEASLNDLKSTDTSEMTEDQKSDITSKIADLENTQIPNAKQAEQDAKDALDRAKEDLETLKNKKDELENGEDGLKSLQEKMKVLETEISEKYPEITTLMNAYHDAQAAYETEKSNEISKAKTGVSEAQAYVGKVENAITSLKNKELQQEYSAQTYDAAEGQRLVDTARQMLMQYGSTRGLCASGVSRTIKMAYGISMHGNGCDWDTNMEELVRRGMFMEVTSDYPSSDNLKDLPAGAVVCWEATSGTGGGGAQYGHVTIADGKGGEISDHYEQYIFRSVGGRKDTYRIFIPI